jgi:serine/threonine-protein kinase
MLAAGQSLGRYRIDAVLGRGAMGIVYRAWDASLSRAVAVKVISGDDAMPDAEARARFFREGRLAAQLAHKNVVAVYEVAEVEGRAFLAMELVEGAALRAFVGATAVSIGVRARWLADVARALAAAHAVGLVHRDVKPENVLVAKNGTAKLADFGIVKRMPDGSPMSFRTKTGQLVGTPEYMAPEQWAGASIDGRVDQYAWGLVAYELLAARAMPLGKPPPLAVIAPEVPPALSEIVGRAIEHERERRFASMDEIVRALAPFEASDADAANAAMLPIAAAQLASAPTIAANVQPAVAPTLDMTDGREARSAERPEGALGGVGGRSPPTVNDASPFGPTIAAAPQSPRVVITPAPSASKRRPKKRGMNVFLIAAIVTTLVGLLVVAAIAVGSYLGDQRLRDTGQKQK